MAGSAYKDIAGARGAFSVTPSDATTFSTTRGLYIGVAGNVAVTMAQGMAQTFTNVPVGVLPIQVTQVLSTGTTATGIVGLY